MKNVEKNNVNRYPVVLLAFGLKEMMIANQTDLCVLIDHELQYLIVSDDESRIGRENITDDEIVFAADLDLTFPDEMSIDEKMMALFFSATEIIECAEEQMLFGQVA